MAHGDNRTIVGVVIAAGVILRKGIESMLETVSYEHMLAGVNDEGESFKRSRAHFLL